MILSADVGTTNKTGRLNEMALNTQLLKRLRRRFLRMRHERHFLMDVIAVKTDCGSQMCIAGHLLDLAGYKRRLREEKDRTTVLDFDFYSPSGQRVRNPLNAAAREIGLSYRRSMNNKAYSLFHDWELTTPKLAAERIQELIEESK